MNPKTNEMFAVGRRRNTITGKQRMTRAYREHCQRQTAIYHNRLAALRNLEQWEKRKEIEKSSGRNPGECGMVGDMEVSRPR